MPSHSKSSGTTTKWLALLAVCLAAAAMPLTFTGTAVALPSIGRALGGSPVASAWVTNAFMLTFGSTLMAAGALADSYGRKQIFLAGVGSFAVFSLALVFAPDIVIFDLLRAAQGFAAAAAFSGGMAALAQEFDGEERLRAFSIVGTSFGVGLSLGPVASGLMIEAFGWRSIFLAVVVFAFLAFCSRLARVEGKPGPGVSRARLGRSAQLYCSAWSLHLRHSAGAGARMGRFWGCDIADRRVAPPRHIRGDRTDGLPADARPLAVCLSTLCRRSAACGSASLWLRCIADPASGTLHRHRRPARDRGGYADDRALGAAADPAHCGRPPDALVPSGHDLWNRTADLGRRPVLAGADPGRWRRYG